MIRRVKQFQTEALINSPNFRDFVEKAESEILRGISTVVVLKIINNHASEGIYGYLLLRELEESTKKILVIEEGTLYPLLKKLEKNGVIRSKHKQVKGRSRKYFFITPEGQKIQNHLMGFFSKLIESMSGLMEIKVDLPEKNVLFCPNCANKIDLLDPNAHFCEVCGLNIQNLITGPKTKSKKSGDK
ncbi:MAG: PadR family transcriptional regulator [Promethearchaeota archaeon]